MSEEEKRAIEFIKDWEYIEFEDDKEYKEFEKDINIVFKLIEKQQKEIEKLTRLNSAYKTNYYSKVLKEERKNKKISEGYISKDKIRNLLKQVNASLYHFKDSEKNNIIQRIKDRLEQLLDDKN